jgi:TonB family protein
VEDRAKLKSDKGNFEVGSKDIKDIGGDTGPSLAGAGPAPTLAIRTGNKGSVEKFSAAPIQKSDKGRIGGVAVENVGGPQLGLRDSIIARDAAPTQIASGRAGGVAGGVPGGVPGASKRDAGRFGGTEGGAVGGVAGGRGSVVGGTGTSTIATGGAAAPTRAREKKSMFTITGPLKDRQILRQVAPEYPSWAQQQGIEASVVLEFTVDTAGEVKPNIVVRRTSGYPKLDETAIRALRQWKFVPLPADRNEDQVGLITFNYSLS